jgi:hypothetical protein
MWIYLSRALSELLSLAYTEQTVYPQDVCMYVCMYDGWAKRYGLCTATFKDPICFPFLINLLLILHLEWSVGLCLWGRHSSHLVLWKTSPGDEILNKLWPHNHIGYVCLIRLLLGTFRKWGWSVSPSLKRWQCPVKSPTTHLNCSLFNFNTSFVLLAEGISAGCEGLRLSS